MLIQKEELAAVSVLASGVEKQDKERMETMSVTNFTLPGDWAVLLREEEQQEYFENLLLFLKEEYAAGEVYPPKESVFAAFSRTEYAATRVVLLGQDPYHGFKQADGLSFSVADQEAKFPPSLRNIFKELETDTGIKRTSSDLSDWADQGILLLNTVLTVRAKEAASHRGKGWERFTDKVIEVLDNRKQPVIFVFWGKDAQKKRRLVTQAHHRIIEAPHPSPLSAYHGFFGSCPFSQINAFLREWDEAEIIWG